MQSIFIYFIMFYIVFPFATFIHELGHALTVLFVLKSPVELSLGTKGKGFSFTIGRMTLSIHPINAWIGYVSAPPEGGNQSFGYAVVAIAGPIFSILLSPGCYSLLLYGEFSSTMQL
jgi:hypothetical protein